METAETTWPLLLAANTMAEELEREGRARTFAVTGSGDLQETGSGPEAVLAWCPQIGWHSRLPADDPRGAMLDLYLPLCGATRRRPITVGHLGQSLDGFIATPSGDSQFVTGEHNIVHLHRLRAL